MKEWYVIPLKIIIAKLFFYILSYINNKNWYIKNIRWDTVNECNFSTILISTLIINLLIIQQFVKSNAPPINLFEKSKMNNLLLEKILVMKKP